MEHDILEIENHIRQIQEKLWCGREYRYGKASIMIGAGFSRNAEKANVGVAEMPTLRQLAEIMYKSLYDERQYLNEHKIQAVTGSGILKLANEYEAAFTRTGLDDLIIKSLDDNSYNPGKIHKLLLTLPWSDIFTTNYDTLLERTNIFVPERRYEVVHTKEDIPGKMKPRIVKLHGSLPSNRPFIITEEDYRTYSKNFAPFVNMVQQSIMENALCLLGFSGDDPNFLWWTGWVRDNLGEKNIPPIYLCGILNLSASQKKLLTDRKIIPIDFSHIFPIKSGESEQIRHEKAIEWFLLKLLYAKSPDIIGWPNIHTDVNVDPSNYISDIIKKPTFEENEEQSNFNKRGEEITKEDLINLKNGWSKKRSKYPGWIVLPVKNRETLWKNTKYYIDDILNNINIVGYQEDVDILFELNWRLEKALIPLLEPWVEKYLSIINKYNPFPENIENNFEISRGSEKYKNLNWDKIQKTWIFLVFAVIKASRINSNDEIFDHWNNIIGKIVNYDKEVYAKWHYEKCLYQLNKLNKKNVRKELDEWNHEECSMFWHIKKASILAELGYFTEAEEISEKALDGIRKSNISGITNYQILSQEAWAMVLVRAIKDNKNIKSGIFKISNTDFTSRWMNLENYRCNPWMEFEHLEFILKNRKPQYKPDKETKIGFDPGNIHEVIHFGGGNNIDEYFPAYSCILLFEEGGLPLKCGAFGMFSDCAIVAANWLYILNPILSVNIMVRTGHNKIGELLTRVNVALLDEKEIDILKKVVYSNLVKSMNDIINNEGKIDLWRTDFAYRNIETFVEIISRLCFRFDEVYLNKIFDLAVEMYKTSVFRKYFNFHETVWLIMERVLNSFTNKQLLSKLIQIISLPIPNDTDFKVHEPQRWIEPIDYVRFSGKNDIKRKSNDEFTLIINELIIKAKNGKLEGRKRAINRLNRLFEMELLTQGEIDLFADAIWSRLNPENNLPIETGFLDNYFLFLPEINKGNAKNVLKKYYLNASFPKIVEKCKMFDGKEGTSVTIGSTKYYHINNIIWASYKAIDNGKDSDKYIDWNADEAYELFKKVKIMWDTEKVFLNKYEEVKIQLSKLVDLLGRVIMPRMIDAKEQEKAEIFNLINEMENNKIEILYLLPYKFMFSKELLDATVNKLKKGINSLEESISRNAIEGLMAWLFLADKKLLESPPRELFDEFINNITSRRQPGLKVSLHYVSLVFERELNIIDDKHISEMSIFLEFVKKETELPNRDTFDVFINNTKSLFDIEELPEYLRLTANVAQKIFKYLNQKGKAIPSIIMEWKGIAETCIFPEVRKEWIE